MTTNRSKPVSAGRHRLAIASLGLALLAGGCDDGERVAALEERLAVLEADAIKRADEAQLSIESLQSARDQLMQRLEHSELQSRTALEQIDNLGTSQQSRFTTLEDAFSALARRRENLESIAYLPVGFNNHATLGTAHGTFLVRIGSVLPSTGDAEGDYTVTLNIGNPLGLSVQEFTLRGHFGQLTPDTQIGESDADARKRYQDWEKSLVPFQHLFIKDLPPGEWTRVELPINTAQLSDIRMLRFAMIVERAFLDNLAGIGDLAVVSALEDSTAVARTPYGAFLVNCGGATPEGVGHRINLAVGNPFILTVEKVRLRGEFGRKPPKRQEGESLPTYAHRLSEWQAQLTPFDTTIDTPILPGRWSDATIFLPTKAIGELGYIRFNFKPESAYLPVPKGASGPQ